MPRLIPLLLLVPASLLRAGELDSVDLDMVDANEGPAAEHLEQSEILELLLAGDREDAFELAFEHGDELFETVFNAVDGVGANVGRGQRFTRVPRADMIGPGQWAKHLPKRATGPNAASCNDCHRIPVDDGAGLISANVVRDPLHTGKVGMTIERNTPHLFGMGAVQRLAEEMTAVLQAARDEAAAETCRTGSTVTRRLVAKGVSFGTLRASPDGSPCKPRFDFSAVAGVGTDLVVRPFQWKGNFAFVRDFNRDASHNELGLQAVELVGTDVDGDFDGVTNELTVGDQTALAIYLAAQPRPTTRTELAALKLIPPIPSTEAAAIARGRDLFGAIRCTSCHMPSLTIDAPTFSEPSQSPSYCDKVFPGGQSPRSLGVDSRFPVTFDLTRDQPDNIIVDGSGRVIFRLGSFEKDRQGRAIVRLYGDLKRHDIGHGLAESIDETKTGASTFLTENLWGCGSTAPYLHDGRATTLTEAILAHGGEAITSRQAFVALSPASQAAVIAFLNDMVLFRLPEEEE